MLSEPTLPPTTTYREAAFRPDGPRLVLPRPVRARSFAPLLLFAALAAVLDVLFLFPAQEFTAWRVGHEVHCSVTRTSALRRHERTRVLARPTRVFQQYRSGRPPSRRLVVDTAQGAVVVLPDSDADEVSVLEAVVEGRVASGERVTVRSGWRFAVFAFFGAVVLAPVAIFAALVAIVRRRRLLVERDGAGQARLRAVDGRATVWSSGPFPAGSLREIRFEDRPGHAFKTLVVDVAGAPPMDVPLRLGPTSAQAIEDFVRADT